MTMMVWVLGRIDDKGHLAYDIGYQQYNFIKSSIKLVSVNGNVSDANYLCENTL